MSYKNIYFILKNLILVWFWNSFFIFVGNFCWE